MGTTIAGAAITTPSSNTFVGNTGVKLLSMWDTVTGLVSPNTLNEIFKQQSFGVMFRDILFAKGMQKDIPAQDMNVIQELAWERPIVTTGTTAATSAGADITIKLASSNYEATTMSPVQELDVILVPAQYLVSGLNNSAEYQVISRTTVTLTYDTLVCSPLSSDSNLISTGIPSGTVLALSGNRYARGTHQPKGKQTFPATASYTTAIQKVTVGLEEDVLAYQLEPAEYKGFRWIINDLTVKADRDLDRYEDAVLHHGQANTTLLTQSSHITDEDGYTRSCDGLTTLMDANSMCDYYDTTVAISHLNAVTDGMRAQGVATSDIAAYPGIGYMNDIYDIFRDFMKEYSSTDLYDRAKNMLGVTPTVLNFNNFNIYFQVLSSNSNPSNLGLAVDGDYTYEYPNACFFIPDSPITAQKFGKETNVSIPHIGVGRVNCNGENNGRVYGTLKGMTNLEQGNLGTDAAGVFYYEKSEVLLFGGNWNELFYMRKQK